MITQNVVRVEVGKEVESILDRDRLVGKDISLGITEKKLKNIKNITIKNEVRVGIEVAVFPILIVVGRNLILRNIIK